MGAFKFETVRKGSRKLQMFLKTVVASFALDHDIFLPIRKIVVFLHRETKTETMA